MMIAPAARSIDTSVASSDGVRPACSTVPSSVGMSPVSMMSLTPTGMPCSGPSALPSRRRASASRAWRKACSGSRNAQACTRSSSVLMRARHACTSSSELILPSASARAASAAPSRDKSIGISIFIGQARGCLHSTKYVYILVFWGGPRWCASCCETTNGGALNGWWQAKKVIRAALDGITGYSWRLCYGLPGQVVPCAICRASSVVGTRRTFASHVGASAGCGSAWRRFSMAMLTWNNCLLTLPSFEPTNMRLAPKKRRRSGDRALARRTEHQGAHRGGCVGQSTAADSERWTDRRYRPCRRPDCLYPRQGNHRRQGLRCRYFDPGHSSQRGASGYPASLQPQGTQALRYPSVQGSQSHRAILRSHQAISAHCHSVRQARSQLYGILASSLHLRLARLNVNSP